MFCFHTQRIFKICYVYGNHFSTIVMLVLQYTKGYIKLNYGHVFCRFWSLFEPSPL